MSIRKTLFPELRTGSAGQPLEDPAQIRPVGKARLVCKIISARIHLLDFTKEDAGTPWTAIVKDTDLTVSDIDGQGKGAVL